MTELEHPDIGTIPVIEHPPQFEHAASGFEVPPPLLGEHNREVFRDLGYSETELDKLDAAGVFGDPDSDG